MKPTIHVANLWRQMLPISKGTLLGIIMHAEFCHRQATNNLDAVMSQLRIEPFGIRLIDSLLLVFLFTCPLKLDTVLDKLPRTPAP